MLLKVSSAGEPVTEYLRCTFFDMWNKVDFLFLGNPKNSNVLPTTDWLTA